jgi:hypothetical protein
MAGITGFHRSPPLVQGAVARHWYMDSEIPPRKSGPAPYTHTMTRDNIHLRHVPSQVRMQVAAALCLYRVLSLDKFNSWLTAFDASLRGAALRLTVLNTSLRFATADGVRCQPPLRYGWKRYPIPGSVSSWRGCEGSSSSF